MAVPRSDARDRFIWPPSSAAIGLRFCRGAEWSATAERAATMMLPLIRDPVIALSRRRPSKVAPASALDESCRSCGFAPYNARSIRIARGEDLAPWTVVIVHTSGQDPTEAIERRRAAGLRDVGLRGSVHRGQ